ncbi:hypothetical protein [Vibrio sp. dhg]|uniref:hypothetical protein n=1 Tax=Vibrio sp. dhg TaxID=2163016 RepID=UPI0013C34CEA|nr:hypothetical protein [Vibrio sp. dhg]
MFGSSLLIDNIVKNLKPNMRDLDEKTRNLALWLWMKNKVVIYCLYMNELEGSAR